MFEWQGFHSISQCWAMSGDLLSFVTQLLMVVGFAVCRVVATGSAALWVLSWAFKGVVWVAGKVKGKAKPSAQQAGPRPTVVTPGPTTWGKN